MTVDAIGPSHYTDVQGLNTLRTQARAQDPEALRSTAKQFETIFTKMMLQSMRDARLRQQEAEAEAQQDEPEGHEARQMLKDVDFKANPYEAVEGADAVTAMPLESF